ncbi:MAG: ABC transporter ATP-binding protein [Candidatus Aenigmatarchaeota archaeon]
MSAIEVENLSKKFEIRKGINNGKKGLLERLKIRSPPKKDIWALKDISFEVQKGEWLGIVGENGSGKTTLLKIIGNVMSPTKGEVKTKGKIASLIGLGTGFKDELTARENIYLYSSLMGLSKEEIENKFQDIVSFSELYDYMDTKFKKFSDGMKMRLAFSTAMNVEADIFLSDEILTVGDGEFQEKCLQKMEEFKKKNKTIIFVSHSLSSIKKWCDRVIFLDDGKIRERGSVGKVLNEYRRFLVWKGKNEEFRRFKNEIDEDEVNDLVFYNESDKESYIFNKGESLHGEISLTREVDKLKIRFSSVKSNDEKLVLYCSSLSHKQSILNFTI